MFFDALFDLSVNGRQRNATYRQSRHRQCETRRDKDLKRMLMLMLSWLMIERELKRVIPDAVVWF